MEAGKAGVLMLHKALGNDDDDGALLLSSAQVCHPCVCHVMCVSCDVCVMYQSVMSAACRAGREKNEALE